ncbi:MAG: hypothetical protein ACR2MT_08755, partial [Aurantibacter sp.]
ESLLENAKVETEAESSFELDFLPVVIGKAKKDVTNRYRPNSEFVYNDQNVLDCQVIFETVQFKSRSENENIESDASITVEDGPDFLPESPSLDFLPLVVAPEKTSDMGTPADTKEPMDISAIPVTYSEVKIETPKSEANKILSERNEPVPPPKVPKIKKKTKRKKNAPKNLKEPTSTNDIDMKKVKEIKCTGVELKIENQKAVQENILPIEYTSQENTDNPMDQNGQYILDWIMAENEAEGELKQKIKTIVTKQEVAALKLPKPEFYAEHEANTVVLLDDIEAFGDEREVALLRDLLLEVETLSLRERIYFLIEKISDTSVLKREPIVPSTGDGEVFSIFEEFFRTIDTASKLILLDEIVAVGDEKEIAFLTRLSQSSSAEVRRKAKVCLEKLTQKLIEEKGHQQTESSKPKVELELGEPVVKKNESESLPADNEAVIDTSLSLFEIDFELSIEDREASDQKPK